MTPKQKADELVDKFQEHVQYWDCRNDVPLEEKHSKHCAIICVDDTLEALEHNHWQNIHWIGYYEEVKQEIEKL